MKAMVPNKEVLQNSIQGMRKELYGIRNQMHNTVRMYYKYPERRRETQIYLTRKCRRLERIIDEMMFILITTKINSTKITS